MLDRVHLFTVPSVFCAAEVQKRVPDALASPPVASAPEELVLDSVRGQGYVVRDWLTSYPLLMVALDPYTHESAWILETAGRFLRHFSPADVRTAWLCATDDEGCKQFLGPWQEEFLTFADPEKDAIKALGFDRLPGLCVINPDLSVEMSNGWDPESWRTITANLARMLSWSRPMVPRPGDPLPFQGTTAF